MDVRGELTPIRGSTPGGANFWGWRSPERGEEKVGSTAVPVLLVLPGIILYTLGTTGTTYGKARKTARKNSERVEINYHKVQCI